MYILVLKSLVPLFSPPAMSKIVDETGFSTFGYETSLREGK